MSKKLTKEEFLNKLSAGQLEMYDLSKFEYVSITTKSKAVCRRHGEFWIRPSNLIAGQGCRVCGYEKLSKKLSVARKIDVSGWETKRCPTCGEEKPLNEFGSQPRGLCGRRAECKTCCNIKTRRRSLVGKKLKMFVTHKKCNTCGECLPAELFRETGRRGKTILFHQCSWCEKTASKKIREEKKQYFRRYREVNKKKLRDNAREYCRENAETLSLKAKEDNKKMAGFLAFGSKLPSVDEATEGAGGLLLVRCKHCEAFFTPTKVQCKVRMAAVKGYSRGEGNLYCSEKCKASCDVYRVKFIRKSERSKSRTARGCQQTPGKAIRESQCGEVSYNYCEKCGDIIDVELHHTIEVAVGGDVHNPAGFIMLCTRCHDLVHSSCK